VFLPMAGSPGVQSERKRALCLLTLMPRHLALSEPLLSVPPTSRCEAHKVSAGRTVRGLQTSAVRNKDIVYSTINLARKQKEQAVWNVSMKAD